MMEIQCQVTVEAPHESLSIEVMALLTTMKSVMPSFKNLSTLTYHLFKQATRKF